jgi:hypothetical protein
VLCTEVLYHLLLAAVQTVHQLSAPPVPRLSLVSHRVDDLANRIMWGTTGEGPPGRGGTVLAHAPSKQPGVGKKGNENPASSLVVPWPVQ